MTRPNEYESEKCVRAGCFHTLNKHNLALICTIEGCKCNAFLETRVTMPSDKLKSSFPPQPPNLGVVPTHEHNFEYSHEKNFLVCACGEEVDSFMFPENRAEKALAAEQDERSAAYVTHTGSRGGGKTYEQQVALREAITEDGKRILREGIQNILLNQAEIAYQAWFEASIDNEYAEKHEAFIAGYLAGKQ